MIPYVDMTVCLRQDKEHMPRHSHTTYYTQMWDFHFIEEAMSHLPSVLTHRPHYIDTLATYLYPSGTVTVPLTETAFLTLHLMKMSAQAKHTLWTPKLITVRLPTVQVIMTLIK